MKGRELINYLMLAAIILVLPITSNAQDVTNNKLGKGIKVVAKDSSFALKFEFRTQTLYAGVYNTESGQYHDKFMIRRARLKFGGFAYSPKLTYKIELGLSNRDISGADLPQKGKSPGIILDAVLKYQFHKNWSVWVGQTKLPGNIERVISSSKLQFVDRSNLNSRYNIDRDVGIQLRYSGKKIRLKGAISNGEGRNITIDNLGGYDYTGRIEWLPLGKFTGKGDYFSSDLKREETPKLMLAATYDYNDRATRERGQNGSFLSETRTLKTWFADAHFKYKGFSAMGEYAHKRAVDGSFIEDDQGNFLESFYVGDGINMQMGYLFKNNFEIAGRYTNISPEADTRKNENTQYTIGVSKYIVGHSLKIQSDATLIQEVSKPDLFMYRFQIEFSI